MYTRTKIERQVISLQIFNACTSYIFNNEDKDQNV